MVVGKLAAYVPDLPHNGDDVDVDDDVVFFKMVKNHLKISTSTRSETTSTTSSAMTSTTSKIGKVPQNFDVDADTPKYESTTPNLETCEIKLD